MVLRVLRKRMIGSKFLLCCALTQDDPEDNAISQDWHDKDQAETKSPDQLTQAPLNVRLTETCKSYLKLVKSSEKF